MVEPLHIPVPEKGECHVTDQDYGMLKMHALNGSQRMADGAGHYAENLRYDYLEGKERVSFAESAGYRMTTESGSGRSRAETNAPAATSAGQ